MTPHLTHEQLCDLILARSPHPLSSDYAALEQHLHTCPACTEELTRLSRSLKLFRTASTAYARQQLAEIHAQRASVLPSPRSLTGPLAWLTAAAAAFLLAALVPFGMHHRHAATPSEASTTALTQPASASAQTTESDEALLEEVDQDISSSVPSPMRPLADPTASSTVSRANSTPAKIN